MTAYITPDEYRAWRSKLSEDQSDSDEILMIDAEAASEMIDQYTYRNFGLQSPVTDFVINDPKLSNFIGEWASIDSISDSSGSMLVGGDSPEQHIRYGNTDYFLEHDEGNSRMPITVLHLAEGHSSVTIDAGVMGWVEVPARVRMCALELMGLRRNEGARAFVNRETGEDMVSQAAQLLLREYLDGLRRHSAFYEQ